MERTIDTEMEAIKNYWINLISEMNREDLLETEADLAYFLTSVIELLEEYLEPSRTKQICLGSCELRSFRALECIIPSRFLEVESLPLASKYKFAKYSLDWLIEKEYDLTLPQLSLE